MPVLPRVGARARTAWEGFFFTGFTGDSLAALRLALGLLLILFHVIQFETLLRLDPSGAAFVYLDPMWHFAWLGLERLYPVVCYAVFALLVASSMTLK